MLLNKILDYKSLYKFNYQCNNWLFGGDCYKLTFCEVDQDSNKPILCTKHKDFFCQKCSQIMFCGCCATMNHYKCPNCNDPFPSKPRDLTCEECEGIIDNEQHCVCLFCDNRLCRDCIRHAKYSLDNFPRFACLTCQAISKEPIA